MQSSPPSKPPCKHTIQQYTNKKKDKKTNLDDLAGSSKVTSSETLVLDELCVHLLKKKSMKKRTKFEGNKECNSL